MGILHVTRTIIRYLPGPPPLPESSPEIHALAQYVRTGRCILFVGAGLSASAGIPTWSGLMDYLIKKITCWGISEGVVPDHISIADDARKAWKEEIVTKVCAEMGKENFKKLVAQIRKKEKLEPVQEAILLALEIVGRASRERAQLIKLLEQKRFPELAEYCRNRLGEDEFNAQVRHALQPQKELPAVYRDIVHTPFSCVVTTNFDLLLEQAYQKFDEKGIPRAPAGAELTQLGTLLIDKSFFILKAHGDILRPEAMVFSSDDYRRLIHATPAFQAIFQSMLMTHALLFVGYSLSDTNFRLLLDQQFTLFDGKVPPRYALLSGIKEAEEEILWKTARLQVLSYPEGKHEHVGIFLKKLSAITNESKKNKAAPSESQLNKNTDPDFILRTALEGRVLHLQLEDKRTADCKLVNWAATIDQRSLEDLGKLIKIAVDAHKLRNNCLKEIQDAGRALAHLLPAAFFKALDNLPTQSHCRIACSHETHSIPWEWLPVTKTPFCLRNAVYRDCTSLSNIARGYRAFNRNPRALIIGDSGSGQPQQLPLLDEAKREGEEIAGLLKKTFLRKHVTLLSRETATRQRILYELKEGNYDIVHFAGHAWIDDRESYIWAWDDIMLGSEITPLLCKRPPSLLVMSTHFTSFVPFGMTEDFLAKMTDRSTALSRMKTKDMTDFAEDALRSGVATFVGSFGEPPETDTADAMIFFYEQFLTGASIAKSLLATKKHRIAKGFTSSLQLTATGYGGLKIKE